jgi:hypothetical protein
LLPLTAAWRRLPAALAGFMRDRAAYIAQYRSDPLAR